MSNLFSFHLSASFLESYKDREPDWGWKDAAGNSIGELTFVRTYSRIKPNGSKERWFECCARVVNGMYSLQKDHCLANRLEWNGNKAQASAQEAYERLFQLKWTPPGRGLSQMGTPLVMEHKNVASLLNCAFVSTGDMERSDPGYPFAWATESLMLGIGVGFDTLGAGKHEVLAPDETKTDVYVIPDTREGWAISVGKLVNSYLKNDKGRAEFDYSLLRPYGAIIHTFGGTASGPEPLADGIEKMRMILDENVGKTLTSKTITDLFNLIGSFVVAGNARRSAELALGTAGDMDFANLKNPDVYPDRPWGFLSNNSISSTVGMSYDPYIANTVKNGEPGYVWLDTARNYGRLIDPPDYKDSRVKGFNPCQPAWAPVLTKDGLSTIGDISIGDVIWSEDGWVNVENKWVTGVKNVNRYTTTAGFVDVTDTHRVVSRGEKMEARDAEVLDRLSGPESGITYQDADMQDVVNGLIIGDGYKHRASKDQFFLVIGADDTDYFGQIDEFIEHSSAKSYRVRSTLNKDEFARNVYNRTIPQEYMKASAAQVSGLLRGIYSANGSIAGKRVTLKGTSFEMITQVQTLLSSLGIGSYYTTNKATEIKWDNGSYTSRESYDLNIGTAIGKKRFSEIIGFLQEYKNVKLSDVLSKSNMPGRSKTSFDIVSVESLGDHEVFDITVSGENHTYWSNGINVSNCVEQPLESYEMCCLVEVHLNRAESLEDFQRTLKFAYLYGKTVTLLTSPWQRSNAVMLRNRRIGLSTTGVAGFVEEHSLAEYRVWADKGYKKVSSLDVEFSEWLGIRESIRKTTVKPSGSVSLLSGATPGVHWAPGGEFFMRAIRFGETDPIWRLLQDAGYKVEDDVYSPNTKVVYFPLHSKSGRSESEVSLYEKAHLAAEAQKYWSDNGVSVTLSFSEKSESEDVPKILRMYEGQLKAVSFLPMSEGEVYAQAPYTKISESEYKAASKSLTRVDVDTLYGSGREAEGEIYCTTDSCEIPKR